MAYQKVTGVRVRRVKIPLGRVMDKEAQVDARLRGSFLLSSKP